MSFHIEPLTSDNIETASRVAEKCFEHDPSPSRPNDWFSASLSTNALWDLRQKTHEPIGDDLHYWVGIFHGKVVGTTGLYEYEADTHEARWVGWFCLSSEVRGQGFGSQLLEFTIQQARENGMKFLRLYTSDLPEEATAQHLYERHGLRLTGQELAPRGDHNILYREKKLT